MATTTNYGWVTPDDTSLVKDGASAIRTLGTSIDTTTFNNASAAIAKTIVDAKGDIIAATAADTVSRLAVGANDTVLTADSTAGTGLKWAAVASGGLTLLSTTTLSGASTTISSISGAYTNLYCVVFGQTNATADGTMLISANSGASIFTTHTEFTNASVQNFEANLYLRLAFDNAAYRIFRTSANNAWTFTIENYASTTAYKAISFNGAYVRNSGADTGGVTGGGGVVTTSAITSLAFANDGGNFSAGTVLLYGVK
jgi:hypothetical protein